MTPRELLTALTNAVRNGSDVSSDIFAENCDVDAGVDIRTPTDVISRFARVGGEIRHSACDDRSAALMIDFTDEITGLIGRESWCFVLSGGLVCQVFHAWCLLVQERRAVFRREVDPLLRLFGFRAAEPADVDSVQRALHIVSQAAGRPAEVSFDEVLLNNELIYVPFTWVGCSGFLVVRASGRAILLGSGIEVAVHVWAYYRGFADGETSADRLNDLVIMSIQDEVETRRTLLAGFHALPDFKSLPARLAGVDLYFLRPSLLKAELRNWFRFEVQPSTDAA